MSDPVLLRHSVTTMLIPCALIVDEAPRAEGGAGHRAACMLRAVLMTLVLFLAGALNPVLAQRNAPDIPIVSGAYAIENVRIVQSPGRIIESGSVVIRDGLIESVGTDVTIPYDAQRIDGSGKIVYAAFIDGLSTTGVPKPKQESDLPPVPDRSSPPDDRAGIQPQRDVRDLLSADDKSIDELRSKGFGASHVVPHGRMLPGSGAIVLLAGDNAGDMVLRGDVSMFSQFQGARGMYPGTPMAMTAKMRQLFREARRRRTMQTNYETDPGGISRPEFDAVHYAFFPVIDGTKPVFYFVDDVLEIYRAIKLREDLGFNLMLGGLNEAFDAIDILKSADIPLFVTLNLPEKPDWMDAFKADSIQYILDNYDPEERTASYRDLEAEKRNLEARAFMSRAKYTGVASDLAEAGLQFGFATMGMKAKNIRKNIRELIENGLSEDDALAALTVNAAALLGLSGSLGTVDTGKIANLIVADGNVFADSTQYEYVFVDGKKFSYPKKEKKDKEEKPKDDEKP